MANTNGSSELKYSIVLPVYEEADTVARGDDPGHCHRHGAAGRQLRDHRSQ